MAKAPRWDLADFAARASRGVVVCGDAMAVCTVFESNDLLCGEPGCRSLK